MRSSIIAVALGGYPRHRRISASDMPFDRTKPYGPCIVCTSEANIVAHDVVTGDVIDCSRCGDFSVSRKLIDDEVLLLQDPKQRALASHIIRKMQARSDDGSITYAGIFANF